MGFGKTTQTSGLNNYQLEKLIACLHDHGKQGRKQQKSCSYLVVIGRIKEMNETNLAQHLTSNSLMQFVYQGMPGCSNTGVVVFTL